MIKSSDLNEEIYQTSYQIHFGLKLFYGGGGEYA